MPHNSRKGESVVTEPQPCWDIPEDVALAELAAAPGARWPESTVGATAEAVFYPPADRQTQWFGSTYPGSPLGPVVGKIVLHTTETGTWPGYAGGASAPNLTYDPQSHRWRQHFRLDRSARALRDPSSTLVRENRVCVQVECICTCDAAFARKYGYLHVTQLDDRALRDLGAFIRFMHDHWGTPLTAATIWLPYPSSYGDTTARMSGPTYDAYRGVLGHMHVSGNCVSADTPVLCADLTWRPAGDLLPGDELIAFDEDPPDQQGRRLQRSVVVSNAIRRDALLRINTAVGSIRCNYEHPWLVRRGRLDKVLQAAKEWGAWRWVAARDLRPGDIAAYVIEPWQVDRSWEAGWLAGMYDGEGCLSVRKHKAGGIAIYLSCAQRVSPTAEEMLRVIKERVPVYSLKRSVQGLGTAEMVQATICKRADALRMLGMVRPQRLLAKADAVWENASLGKITEKVAIDSIEPYGTGHIAALETSTHTYIAGGFAMHNTHGDPGTINIARIMAYAKGTTPQPQEASDVTPQEMLAAKISSPDARLNGWTLGHLIEWQARMALTQQAATAALAKAVAALASGQTLAQADLDDIQATLAAEPEPPNPPTPA